MSKILMKYNEMTQVYNLWMHSEKSDIKVLSSKIN